MKYCQGVFVFIEFVAIKNKASVWRIFCRRILDIFTDSQGKLCRQALSGGAFILRS